MKISTFIHVISETEIWNAIEKKLIVLDNQIIKYIADNKTNTILKNIPPILIELGIAITKKAEQEVIEGLIEQTTDFQFQSLFLITTTECNLDCDYCFYRSSVSESLKQRRMMTFETAKTSIDRFYEIVSANKVSPNYWQQITFYGGEPLLNKELLTKAIPYAKQKFNDGYTSFVINTNLTILDDEIIELLRDNNIEVQVSIDGSKEIHDQYRKTQNGFGSYDIVINNIKKMLKNGIKVMPMITATNLNVLNLSEVILNIVNETGIDDYAVNVLITDSFVIDDEYTTLLSEQMIKAYEEFGNIAYDYSFVDLYNLLIGKDVRIVRNSCGSTRKISVFPNGKSYSCQALQKLAINSMGTIEEDIISNPNWDIWRSRNRFNNEECLKCVAVASCGGGCATGSYNATGSITGIDTNNCEYTKKLFKQLVFRNKG